MNDETKSKRRHTMSGRLRNRGWKRKLKFTKLMNRTRGKNL